MQLKQLALFLIQGSQPISESVGISADREILITLNVPVVLNLFSHDIASFTKNIDYVALTKRYIEIDQHLAWHFVYYVDCLLCHPPFLCNSND